MEENNRDPDLERGTGVAGLSAIGALLVGAGGVLGSFVATLMGNAIAGGIYMLAAAVAFGLLANAVFRR